MVAAERQVSRRLGDDTVILDAESGVYFSLDEVGSLVWEMLQTPCAVEQICERVLATYEVSAEQCRSDVDQLLAELAKHRLVEFCSASAA